jgi:hypothetical protein
VERRYVVRAGSSLLSFPGSARRAGSKP